MPVPEIVARAVERCRGRDSQGTRHRCRRHAPSGWYPEVGAEDAVQLLLLRPVVLGLARHLEAQRVPPDGEAPLGVFDGDGGVVDAEEEAVLRLPARVALAGRELEDLEVMAVGILEVKGLDAAGVRVSGRQGLRPLEAWGDIVLAQAAIDGVHPAGDQRHMLKPEIVAAAAGRDWAGNRRARWLRCRVAGGRCGCGHRRPR